MSDIRFNRWLHQSGTGGVYQDSAGNVGVGTSVPTTSLNVVGVVSATSFTGPLTGNVTGNLTGNVVGNVTGNVNASGVSTLTSAVITGNAGIQTNNITRSDLVGAGNSFVGLYIGDGFLAFNNTLNRSGGYYIATSVNALNAGPVTLGSTMTLHGTWVIV